MNKLLLVFGLGMGLTAFGCQSEPEKTKAEITKEWQDRSTVPQGYREASQGAGAPPGSRPIKPPAGTGK